MSDFRDKHTTRVFRQPPVSQAGPVEAAALKRGSPLAEVFGRAVMKDSGPESTSTEESSAGSATMEEKNTDSGEPASTIVEIPDSGFEFAGIWRPTMATPDYIGNNAVLLRYLYDQERKHKITMPIKACGIDPIVFNYVDLLLEKEPGDTDTDVPRLYTIPGVESDENGQPVAYELIRVDGNYYMSCVSQYLDEEYLTSVLAEATTAVKGTGEYIYQLVSYRKLIVEPGQSEGQLLCTLRLNTFEMSVLVSYMKSFENMSVVYKTLNGKQCIVFSVK